MTWRIWEKRQIWKNGRNFYSCNLQVWLLYSYSKTIASPVNFTGKIFIKLTPGENEKCGEICTGVGEYTQMSICTPCKVANSTKIANLTEICHGFGEYMTIDEKKGDERLCQFTIFVKIATFQGPLLPSHFTFCQTFREISPNSICLLFCCVGHIRDVALSSRKDSTCGWIKRVKPLFLPNVACENSRFPSRFATENVSRGKTSATRRQKFHTDDVKSVQNPVRSADWWKE